MSKVILIIVCVVLSIGFGIYTYQNNNASVDVQSKLSHATYLYDQEVAIADFKLVDQNNQSFVPDDLNGRWTLWFFGFTYCPDICPTTLGTLSAVLNTLKEEHSISEPISIVFVSVDPNRDSPERLKTYVNAFHKDALGVTAYDDSLAPFLKNMGIIATIQPHEPGDQQYQVDHSSTIFLIAPNKRITAVFGTPHEVPGITQDITTIAEHYRP